MHDQTNLLRVPFRWKSDIAIFTRRVTWNPFTDDLKLGFPLNETFREKMQTFSFTFFITFSQNFALFFVKFSHYFYHFFAKQIEAKFRENETRKNTKFLAKIFFCETILLYRWKPYLILDCLNNLKVIVIYEWSGK